MGPVKDAVQTAVTTPASPETPPPPRRPTPTWTARLVAQPLFWAAVVGVLFGMPVVRSMTRNLQAAPPVLGTLPAFTLTNQRGEPFGTRELAGKVWVADFVFTSCQSACPLLSERMAEVGRRAKKLGPDFHLVSIPSIQSATRPSAWRPTRRATARIRSPGRS